jgi:hypothetical protein
VWWCSKRGAYGASSQQPVSVMTTVVAFRKLVKPKPAIPSTPKKDQKQPVVFTEEFAEAFARVFVQNDPWSEGRRLLCVCDHGRSQFTPFSLVVSFLTGMSLKQLRHDPYQISNTAPEQPVAKRRRFNLELGYCCSCLPPFIVLCSRYLWGGSGSKVRARITRKRTMRCRWLPPATSPRPAGLGVGSRGQATSNASRHAQLEILLGPCLGLAIKHTTPDILNLRLAFPAHPPTPPTPPPPPHNAKLKREAAREPNRSPRRAFKFAELFGLEVGRETKV